MAAVDLTAARQAVARVAEQAKLTEERIDNRLATRDLPASTIERGERPAGAPRTAAARRESAVYRHVIYGWNIYSLYDGQPFPGLADAIRLRDGAREARSCTHRHGESIACNRACARSPQRWLSVSL